MQERFYVDLVELRKKIEERLPEGKEKEEPAAAGATDFDDDIPF